VRTLSAGSGGSRSPGCSSTFSRSSCSNRVRSSVVRPGPPATVPLGLPHPVAEHLGRAPDLLSNRRDRRPLPGGGPGRAQTSSGWHAPALPERSDWVWPWLPSAQGIKPSENPGQFTHPSVPVSRPSRGCGTPPPPRSDSTQREESQARMDGRWWLQRDSNPRFGLERVVSWSVITRAYGVVATGGCHDAFEFELVCH
jgi:hypothetical protein